MQRVWTCVWFHMTVLMFFPGASLLFLYLTDQMIPSGLKTSQIHSTGASERQSSPKGWGILDNYSLNKCSDKYTEWNHCCEQDGGAAWHFFAPEKVKGAVRELGPGLGEHLWSSTVPLGSSHPTALFLLHQEWCLRQNNSTMCILLMGFCFFKRATCSVLDRKCSERVYALCDSPSWWSTAPAGRRSSLWFAARNSLSKTFTLL